MAREVKCYYCDKILNENDERYETKEGNKVCEDCRDTCCGYCDDCEELVDTDELMSVNNNERFVCDSCLNDYYKCDECGDYYDTEHGVGDSRGTFICNDCMDNCGYIVCANCEDLTTDYVDIDGEYYCENCAPEFESRILEYHEFNDWVCKKSKDEEEPPYYIGFELEVEGDDTNNDILDELQINLPVVFAHDGSLDRGFEIISHPLSFKRHMELADKYESVFNDMMKENYKSHDTSTCGLHFHVTRPDNEDIIDRIWLILETYKDELIKFSRRKDEEINRWCNFMSNKSDTIIDSTYSVKKLKGRLDRYSALNLENNDTIEFRFFKGTLNSATFLASLELVNNIVSIASDLSKNITDVSWEYLTRTPYCKAYCELKGIYSNKKIVDKSEIYLEKEKELEKLKIYTRKILSNIASKSVSNIKFKFSPSNNIDGMCRSLYADISELTIIKNKMDCMKYLYDYVGYNKFPDDLKYYKKQLSINAYYTKRIDDLIERWEEMKCVL